MLDTKLVTALALGALLIALPSDVAGPPPARAQDPGSVCTPPVSVTVGAETVDVLPAICPLDAGVNGVPRGAVMAFNLPACPAGWAPFALAAGRTVVGAGAGAGLTPRGPGEIGGEERHLLTGDEMPAHRHGVYRHAATVEPGAPRTNGAGSEDPGTTVLDIGATGLAGGNLPHAIMPPYVALLYCEKA